MQQTPEIANTRLLTPGTDRRTFRHAWQFALFGPIIGDLAFCYGYFLVVGVISSGASLQSIFPTLFVMPIFGLILAHAIGGLPALATGALLYGAGLPARLRLVLAAPIGALTTFIWTFPFALIWQPWSWYLSCLILAAVGAISAVTMVRLKQK